MISLNLVCNPHDMQHAMEPSSVNNPAIRNKLLAWMLHVVAPLLFGSLIYVLFRSPSIQLFDWAGGIGMEGMVRNANSWASGTADSLPSWVIFNLPDGLWAYALTASLCLTWAERPCRERATWLALPLVLTTGSELLQARGIVPGTFDWLDVVTMTCACLVCLFINAPPISIPGGITHAKFT
ncbi:MAG: hypothetical protein COA70_13280 [Planctomycetota bacterium]|nr:MAG: hypothetical protein COA70_13280 [Planctomycetota bacterium]